MQSCFQGSRAELPCPAHDSFDAEQRVKRNFKSALRSMEDGLRAPSSLLYQQIHTEPLIPLSFKRTRPGT